MGEELYRGEGKASGLASDWPERGSANREATGKEAGGGPQPPADKGLDGSYLIFISWPYRYPLLQQCGKKLM